VAPQRLFNNKEATRLLDDAVSQLREPYRSVYVRREYEESSIRGVSVRLGLE